MKTWVIVLIVVVVVVLLVVLALAMARRSRVAQGRKREQAREHLQEAEMRGVRAEQEQALAEEQAARARRERAEVEERTALAEQEARDRAARAGEEQSAADDLRAKAEKIAPDLTADRHPHREPGDTVNPDYPEGGALLHLGALTPGAGGLLLGERLLLRGLRAPHLSFLQVPAGLLLLAHARGAGTPRHRERDEQQDDDRDDDDQNDEPGRHGRSLHDPVH